MDQEYFELIRPYEDASKNMLMRLDALNQDFRTKYKNYPIHNIQNRIKQEESLDNKLLRLGLEPNVENAKTYLMDIAGIRVICYFVKDIYRIVSTIKRQTDLVIIREKDYIKNPKPNGYRSYHVIYGVPVYYADGMEYYPVEIQYRTISMDFWASMEHRICYKADQEIQERVHSCFNDYADVLKGIEESMEEFYTR